MRLKSGTLRHDATLLLAGGMIVRLCGLLFVVILARVFSERQIGIFSFAEAVADMLILVASFNLDSLIVRRIASGPASEAAKRFAPLLGFRLVSGPVYLLVICVVAHFTHSEQRWILPIVGLYTLMESLYICLSDMFVGIGQPAMRARIEVTAELIYSVAFVIAIWARPTLSTLIAVGVLRGLLLVGVVLYLIYVRLGPLRISWDNSLIVAGIPFLLMTSLSILQGKIETVLLGVLSNYETVGVFQLALRLIMAAQFIPQSMNSAFYPRFAAEGLSNQNRVRLFRGAGGLLVLGTFGWIFLLAFHGPLSHLLYGRAAPQVAPVLTSMGMLLPFRFAALFMASMLTAIGRERTVLAAMVAGTAVGLLTDVFLIPRHGAIGASIGLLTSAICQCILIGMAWFQRPTPSEQIVEPAAAATSALSPAIALSDLSNGPS